MPENTLLAFNKWLDDIAWRVHALVRNPTVLERFHEKIWRWHLDVKILDSENEVLESRRDEHMKSILADPRLRDETAGPPRPKWEWWQTSWLIRVRDDVGSQDQMVDIEGWAPPDLIHNEPEKYWPLPLTKRELQIEEKYTLLAAIHDHFCKGVERIGLWPERDWDAESVRDVPEDNVYVVLCCRDVPKLLKPEDRPAIEVFLADVEADLETAAGIFVQEPSDAGQPAAEGEDEEGAWTDGALSEYLGDHVLEQIPRWVFNIAVVVDELLQTPGVRERFERMLWQWAEQESLTAREKNRETIRYRIKLLPQRATTLAHKYAVLAAIHDALSDGRPINPWRGRKRSSARITSWASCFAVMIRVHVPKIADDDRERIEPMVAVVRDDLRSAGLLNDELPAASGADDSAGGNRDKKAAKMSAEGKGEGIVRSGDAVERAPEKDLPPARHLSSGRMSWQDAKDKAGRHVKRNGYPGLKALAKIVGCSSSTMHKAIERSPYLKARKAEYEAERQGKPRETPMTDVVRDNTQQTTEADPLGCLIAEQKADDDDPHPLSDDPPHQSASRRRSR